MNRINQAIREAVIILIVVGLVAVAANAQSQQSIANEILYEKVQRLSDSIQELHTGTSSRYLGYEISLAFPQYQLKSDISRLNGLPVSFSGGSLGGVLANEIGKIRANVGLYYSNSSVPYTINLLAASITSNVYLLRLTKPEYHTIEPYAVLGVHQHLNKFFGHYLDNAATKQYGNNEPLLGTTNATHVAVGGGLEYQLENDRHQFIHLFTEFTYGRTVNTISSNESYTGTSTLNPILITIGVSFGVVK